MTVAVIASHLVRTNNGRRIEQLRIEQNLPVAV